MEIERTFVGLDVHARSVVACALDDRTGELSRARLVPDNETVLAWLQQLPGPVAVVYEAGPTGYGLARFLTGRGVRCVVAAPSKMHRPSGDCLVPGLMETIKPRRIMHGSPTEVPGGASGASDQVDVGRAQGPRQPPERVRADR